jgi:beta-lactam-binding protein with PASTA domain
MTNPPPRDDGWPTREGDTFVKPTQDAPGPPPPDEPEPGRRLGLGLVVGLLVVGLAAAAVAAVLLLTRDNDKEAATTTAPTTTTTTTTAAGTAEVAVPRLVGMKEQQALVRLGEVGLRSQEEFRPTQKPTKLVVSQHPAEATTVKRGTRVTIVVDSGAPEVEVPTVTGIAATDATAKLTALGLRTRTTAVTSSQPAGSVVDQAPRAGAKAPKGSLVVLSVAKAPPVAVPNVVGRPEGDAIAAIESVDLRANSVPVPSPRPAGEVVAQSPAAGAKVDKGSAVRINVARETSGGATTTTSTTTATTPTSVQVPDLELTLLQPATHQLSAIGLLATVKYVPGTSPLETVLDQFPKAGNSAPARSHVTLNISSGKGEERDTVPNVVGQTLEQAVTTLNGVNLRLIFAKVPVTDRTRAGKVVEQTPAPGSNVPGKAQVLVYIGAFNQ